MIPGSILRRLVHANTQPRKDVPQVYYQECQKADGCLPDIDFHSVLILRLPSEYRACYPYIGDKAACRRCMAAMEMLFLYRMPLEDLPLYINHPWLFKCSELFYQKRLSRGLDTGGLDVL